MLSDDNLLLKAGSGPLTEPRTRQNLKTRRATVQDVRSEEDTIAAFIRLKGITQCPTAYAVPTRGLNTPADQAALERYAIDRESRSRQRSAVRSLAFRALEALPAK